MRQRSRAELAAHLRALKRLGTLLAAERDTFIWAYCDLEEKYERLAMLHHREQAKADKLEVELQHMTKMRHEILKKYAALKKQK